VSQCLTCLRKAAPPRSTTTSGVLTRPLPFQLVSIDVVGPRRCGRKRWYYSVIIDHATRFMVTKAYEESPTTSDIIATFKECWMRVFQAPVAVLTDRGSIFRHDKFRSFVTEYLLAVLVYTSPYYPQGNAVNEASHKAIEASLSAQELHLQETRYEDELADATMVYNSVPHVATGQSPNFMMFGTELTLPGWQRYKRDSPDERIRAGAFRLEKLRMQAQAQMLVDRRATSAVKEQISPGDWVIYCLSGSEKSAEAGINIAGKYSASWSLPARVVTVADKVCVVGVWGDFANHRQVPLAQVRKLTGTVPKTLVMANVKLIERYQPRHVKHWSMRDPDAVPSLEWSDLMKVAREKPRTSLEVKTSPRKRKRLKEPPDADVEELQAASQEED
jgi:Integrase core domain